MAERDLYGPTMARLQAAFPGSRWFLNDRKTLGPNGRPIHWSLAPGTGDIVGHVCGRWCEIEMKSRRGHHEALQRLREQVLTADGGVYVVARSPEEAEQRIRERIGSRP